MKTESTKSKIVHSLAWKFMERGGTQGIQFLIQIILARLLLPEDYGIIAVVSVFILLANVFIQSGFNTALIQKKDADEVDFSSVFYLSLFVAFVVYMVLFFTAPYIALFYKMPELVLVLRVLTIVLFFGALISIQNAYISKKMMFKKLFFSSVGAMVISGIVGIVLAFMNFGVWALVAQQLTNQFFTMIILWVSIDWRPKLVFSFSRVKKLFSYGSKLLVSSLINTLYQDIRTLIIAKMFSPDILGFYERGKQFPRLAVTNISTSIQSVMLPALSAEQGDKKRFKSFVRRSIVTTAFIMFPLMVGLAVTAEPLVKLLLTDKWLPAVPFIQIYCAIYVLNPIHTANLQAINALGRSDIFLKLEIIKRVIGLVILAISLPFGVYAIALGGLVNAVISSFVNAYPNLKLLNYSYLEQLRDIMPSFLISLIMGGLVYSFNYLHIQEWVRLLLQIPTGILTYIVLAKTTKNESFTYLIQTLKEIVTKKKHISV